MQSGPNEAKVFFDKKFTTEEAQKRIEEFADDAFYPRPPKGRPEDYSKNRLQLLKDGINLYEKMAAQGTQEFNRAVVLDKLFDKYFEKEDTVLLLANKHDGRDFISAFNEFCMDLAEFMDLNKVDDVTFLLF